MVWKQSDHLAGVAGSRGERKCAELDAEPIHVDVREAQTVLVHHLHENIFARSDVKRALQRVPRIDRERPFACLREMVPDLLKKLMH